MPEMKQRYFKKLQGLCNKEVRTNFKSLCMPHTSFITKIPERCKVPTHFGIWK